MNILLNAAFSFVIKWVASNELSPAQIDQVKNLIVSLERKVIDPFFKHQQTADLIKLFAKNLSDTAVDVIVKLLLLKVRSNA